MRQHYLPAVLGLSAVLALGVSIVGCDEANPTAPDNTVLFITANPTQIALNGSSQIAVTGFKPDGNPLNPGTQIIFEATFGVVNPSIVGADGNGRATTTFTSDGTLPVGAMGNPTTATVTASLVTSGGGGGGGGGMGGGSGSSTGVGSVTVNIQIGQTKPAITISASPNRINIEQEATISVLAREADGSPRSGGRVRLRSTLGLLNEETLVTDANGEAETVLRSDGRSGMAELTGTVDNGDEVMTTVTIILTQLNLTANPSIIDINNLEGGEDPNASLDTSEITVQVRDEDGLPLVKGHDVELTATLGVLLPGVVDPVTAADAREASSTLTVKSGADGKATATYIGGERAGTDTVTALLGNAQAGTSSITLRDAPATVSLDVTPTSFTPVTEGTMFELTVRVSNAQGEPLVNELVRFETVPDVSPTFTPPGGPSTNASGLATSTMTVTATGVNNLPAGTTSFTITAFVRDVRSNTVTINIS